MEEEGNILNVIDENGEEVEIFIIDIFSLDEYPGKEYILYTKGEEEGEYVKSYVSILNETEDSADIIAIEDEEEFNKVQNEINNRMSEGE